MSQEIEPTLAHAIILSDGVIREEGTQKLSYIGSFHNFNSPRFPFTSMPFVATAFISNLRADPGEIKITIRIENSDSGHVICSSTAGIGFKGKVDRNEVFEVPIGMGAITFPGAGLYKAVVLVNNESIGSRDLNVKSITASN